MSRERWPANDLKGRAKPNSKAKHGKFAEPLLPVLSFHPRRLAVSTRKGSIMRLVKRFIVIMVVLISCVGCDQVTKSAAQSHLSETDSRSFLGDTVRLQLAYNAGGFLGLGASLPAQWRVGLFSVGVLMLLLLLLNYALFVKAISVPMLLAFALLLAGGVGNLADRLLYEGVVVDFINIGIGRVRTGIFNVADIAVTAGVLALSVVMLQGSSKSAQPDVESDVRKEPDTG